MDFYKILREESRKAAGLIKFEQDEYGEWEWIGTDSQWKKAEEIENALLEKAMN